MYALLKVLHIVSVVLFLGNITTGLFWKRFADATGDARLQAHALAGITRSDALFTMPASIIILVSGFGLAQTAGLPVFGTPWISYSLIAFGTSGAVFGIWIAPLQRRLQSIAERGGEDWPSSEYKSLSLRWELAGLVAIALPALALCLMVVKRG